MILIRVSNITERQASTIFLFTGEVCNGEAYVFTTPSTPTCFADIGNFIAVSLQGEYLGWKIYTDSECQNQVSIISVSGSGEPNCYLVEGNGGHSIEWVV